MFRIPRVPTSIEVMRDICEKLKLNSKGVKELAKELSKSTVTMKNYLISMKRFKLINRSGRRYELLEAGAKFIDFAKLMPLEDALYKAIVEYGDFTDIKEVLKLLVNGFKPTKRSHIDFIRSWTIFLRKLKLIDEDGKLTPDGQRLLQSEDLKEFLLKNPSLLSRKIVYCPGYEFKKSDLLPKAVQHDLGMILATEKLEKMGFRRICVELKCGVPDSVLVKDSRIYIHEHKTGKLDKVAFVQALLYSKEYEKEYGELPGIILTNSEDVKIYESGEVRECVEIFDKVLDIIIRKLIAREYTPGYYCSYCGNSNCPNSNSF